VIIVAHRLSSVRGVDHIVVLDHGRVVEAGSPQALITQGGHYARMAAIS
jgi:ABC-type multidrug transport system fused ATPase/permease subunit